jgi:hypothetical protein
MRVRELNKWIEAGEYARVMAGDYPRRGEPNPDDFVDEVKKTAQSYKESVSSSKDPFLRALRDLGGGVAATGASVFDFFKRSAQGFGKGGKGAPAEPDGDAEGDDSPDHKKSGD